jgi:hypothetical protein
MGIYVGVNGKALSISAEAGAGGAGGQQEDYRFGNILINGNFGIRQWPVNSVIDTTHSTWTSGYIADCWKASVITASNSGIDSGVTFSESNYDYSLKMYIHDYGDSGGSSEAKITQSIDRLDFPWPPPSDNKYTFSIMYNNDGNVHPKVKFIVDRDIVYTTELPDTNGQWRVYSEVVTISNFAKSPLIDSNYAYNTLITPKFEVEISIGDHTPHLGTGAILYIKYVKLEPGVVTPTDYFWYDRATELARARRYFVNVLYPYNNQAGANMKYNFLGIGRVTMAAEVTIPILLPVPLRSLPPTVVIDDISLSANFQQSMSGGSFNLSLSTNQWVYEEAFSGSSHICYRIPHSGSISAGEHVFVACRCNTYKACLGFSAHDA